MLNSPKLALICACFYLAGCEEKPAEIKIASEIFLTYCINQNLENYNRLCKGKKISWEGMPVMISEGSSDYGVRVVIFNKTEPSFAIDSKGLEAHVNRSDLGKIIHFSGTIGEKNYWHPDINQINNVKLGNLSDLIPAGYFPYNWNLWEKFEESKVIKIVPVPSLGIRASVPVQTNYYFTNALTPLKRDSNGFLEATFLLKTEKGFIAEYGENTGIFPKIFTYKINCSSNTVKKVFEGTMQAEVERNDIEIDQNTGGKALKYTPPNIKLVNFWVKDKDDTEGWKEAADELRPALVKACSMK